MVATIGCGVFISNPKRSSNKSETIFERATRYRGYNAYALLFIVVCSCIIGDIIPDNIVIKLKDGTTLKVPDWGGEIDIDNCLTYFDWKYGSNYYDELDREKIIDIERYNDDLFILSAYGDDFKQQAYGSLDEAACDGLKYWDGLSQSDKNNYHSIWLTDNEPLIFISLTTVDEWIENQNVSSSEMLINIIEEVDICQDIEKVVHALMKSIKQYTPKPIIDLYVGKLNSAIQPLLFDMNLTVNQAYAVTLMNNGATSNEASAIMSSMLSRDVAPQNVLLDRKRGMNKIEKN